MWPLNQPTTNKTVSSTLVLIRPGKFDAGRRNVDLGAAVAKDNLALHTTADIACLYLWYFFFCLKCTNCLPLPYFKNQLLRFLGSTELSATSWSSHMVRSDVSWVLSRHEGNGRAGSRSLQINSKGATYNNNKNKKKQWKMSLESFYFHSLQPGVSPGIFYRGGQGGHLSAGGWHTTTKKPSSYQQFFCLFTFFFLLDCSIKSRWKLRSRLEEAPPDMFLLCYI